MRTKRLTIELDMKWNLCGLAVIATTRELHLVLAWAHIRIARGY